MLLPEEVPPLYGTMVSQNLTPDFDKYYGVEPNEEFPVAMWLERAGERVDVPGASFGLALVACVTFPGLSAARSAPSDGSRRIGDRIQELRRWHLPPPHRSGCLCYNAQVQAPFSRLQRPPSRRQLRSACRYAPRLVLRGSELVLARTIRPLGPRRTATAIQALRTHPML
jgi:hypothetical protein